MPSDQERLSQAIRRSQWPGPVLVELINISKRYEQRACCRLDHASLFVVEIPKWFSISYKTTRETSAYAPISTAPPTTMCRYRRVQHTYTICNHTYQLPEVEIKCGETTCKFSPNHPRNCPNCTETCWQYHQYPEQPVRTIRSMCPNCVAAGQ
ncbi:hypothetical protein FB45DRAFT_912865 [Roridomyces roridus]|uniref:Uncharacterized protein n=1 Tax=Roridomyces roridus TaxID=1738132 RepID=A0AAD7BWP3_9AGAR|nr:hypothetical protein FB45DRAFT_912865 [Roridomyces roridus]